MSIHFLIHQFSINLCFSHILMTFIVRVVLHPRMHYLDHLQNFLLSKIPHGGWNHLLYGKYHYGNRYRQSLLLPYVHSLSYNASRTNPRWTRHRTLHSKRNHHLHRNLAHKDSWRHLHFFHYAVLYHWPHLVCHSPSHQSQLANRSAWLPDLSMSPSSCTLSSPPPASPSTLPLHQKTLFPICFTNPSRPSKKEKSLWIKCTWTIWVISNPLLHPAAFGPPLAPLWRKKSTLLSSFLPTSLRMSWKKSTMKICPIPSTKKK